MSRDSFQRVMADFLRSPELCRKAKYRELNNYDLTRSEVSQLMSIASHPGMIVNCMIYRAGSVNLHPKLTRDLH